MIKVETLVGFRGINFKNLEKLEGTDDNYVYKNLGMSFLYNFQMLDGHRAAIHWLYIFEAGDEGLKWVGREISFIPWR